MRFITLSKLLREWYAILGYTRVHFYAGAHAFAFLREILRIPRCRRCVWTACSPVDNAASSWGAGRLHARLTAVVIRRTMSDENTRVCRQIDRQSTAHDDTDKNVPRIFVWGRRQGRGAGFRFNELDTLQLLYWQFLVLITRFNDIHVVDKLNVSPRTPARRFDAHCSAVSLLVNTL